MASRPTPTAEPDGVVHRVALPPSDARAGGRLGGAARAAALATARRYAGLASQLDDHGPAGVPPGLWPATDDIAAVDPIIAANPALAAYAAQLRAKRGERPVAPPHGLPLTVRRDRSATGPTALPGALARRAVPTDAPRDPDVVAAVRGRTAPTTSTVARSPGRAR